MKYYFKEYLKLPVLGFEKQSDAYIFMTSIGQLYSLAFTNQRSYYYKEDDLSYEDKTSIFSVEWLSKTFWFMPWYGYQRRTNDNRLRDIVRYLITAWEKIDYFNTKEDIENYIKNLGKKSFFPNNIIVSMNNEKYHNFDVHKLYIINDDKVNIDEKNDFKRYIINSFWELNIWNDWEIDLNNKDIELCRIEKGILFIPLFELFEETSDYELEQFLSQSLIYHGWYKDNLELVRANEKFYKIAWIIDGQHRTMSLKFLDEEILSLKKELEKKVGEYDINLDSVFSFDEIKNSVLNTNISVTSFIKATIEEQANIFIDINNNAKPVDKSLTYDLLPLTETTQSVELAAKKLFDDFNKDENSPFAKVIYNIRSQEAKYLDGREIQKILSQANFINELKSYFKISRWQEKIFYKYFERKDLTPVYWLMYSFFSKINEVYWRDIFDMEDKYKDEDYLLYRTTGFWALLQLLWFILENIKKEKWDYIIDSYNKQAYLDYNNPINREFDSIIRRLYETLDFKRSTISSFRWKWWQTDLVKIIKVLLKMDDIKNYTDEKERAKIENQMRLFNKND